MVCKRVWMLFVLILPFVLQANVTTMAATIVVDASGGGDFTDVQEAVESAAAGDTVLVRPGTYRYISSLAKTVTLMSEAGAEETLIQGIRLENRHQPETIIDGFTVTGGGGDLMGGTAAGGGIVLLNYASPTVRNCIMADNVFGSTYCGPGCNATFERCIFTGTTSGDGVACSSPSSSPTFIECEISHNVRGVYCIDGATPTFINCTITYNGCFGVSGIDGLGTSPTFRNCIISHNEGWGVSGPGYHVGPTGVLTLENCLISDNLAGGVSWRFEMTLTNCLIVGNRGFEISRRGTCGIGGERAVGVSTGQRATLTNCTISGNLGGGVHYGGSTYLSALGSSTFVGNSIVWGNGDNIVPTDQATLDISYSCTADDPHFVRPGHWEDNGTPEDLSDDTWIEGDYRLLPTSPCIDAGSLSGAPAQDIDGNDRPQGGGVDMGAYEFQVPQGTQFIRGDVNSDGTMNISDAVFSLVCQFAEGPKPDCLKAADLDDDGQLDLGDPVYGLNYLFADGPEPPPPFGGCGDDPTADSLGCVKYVYCDAK